MKMSKTRGNANSRCHKKDQQLGDGFIFQSQVIVSAMVLIAFSGTVSAEMDHNFIEGPFETGPQVTIIHHGQFQILNM